MRPQHLKGARDTLRPSQVTKPGVPLVLVGNPSPGPNSFLLPLHNCTLLSRPSLWQYIFSSLAALLQHFPYSFRSLWTVVETRGEGEERKNQCLSCR